MTQFKVLLRYLNIFLCSIVNIYIARVLLELTINRAQKVGFRSCEKTVL